MALIDSNIASAFPEYSVPDVNAYYKKINEWKSIYAGEPPWRNVRRSKLFERGQRRMNMLNVAKLLCDTFSDLTFSEQVEITVSNTQYQAFLDNVLDTSGFWFNLPVLLASGFALGGFVLKPYADNSEILIDFTSAFDFYPFSWRGNTITGGIFQTVRQKGDTTYTLLETQENGVIKHKLYKARSSAIGLGEACPLSECFPDLEEEHKLEDIDIPLFAYFRPACSNNILDGKIPLGISVFANAQDTLNALDVAFDSFTREFVLGRKRIIVPAEAIQTVIDTETGKTERYFDADDEAFVALKYEDINNLKITDNTVELRIEEHVSAINALLNILCTQTGLSPGSLSFDAVQGVKTATEIISQESKTARMIKSNKNMLTETLETLIHGIFALAVSIDALPIAKYDVTIGWQDNVVIDDNTLIDNTIKLYSAGLIDITNAVMRVNKCDETTAADIVAKINGNAAMGTADFFGAEHDAESKNSGE